MSLRPALALLAVLLAQVPWLPCHCADTCVAMPVLTWGDAARRDDHEKPHHRACPAHGCPGEDAPVPDDGEEWHAHGATALEAVLRPLPSLGVLEAASRDLAASPVARALGSCCEPCGPPATELRSTPRAPPGLCAPVCLLL